MLPCFNDQTWTQVDLPPGRQARQTMRGGWIRKGQKSEHGAVFHLKSGLPQKDIPETEDNDVESSPVCLLEKCIFGLRLWGREATFNSETRLPEKHGNRNLSERAMLPCFNDRTWTQVDWLLEDKQDKQYEVVGYARVRKTSTELSSTSKVACRKRTFQKQRIMMLNQAQCVYLKSASLACNNGKERLLSTLETFFLKLWKPSS